MEKPLDTKTVKEIGNMKFTIDGKNFRIEGTFPSVDVAPISKSGKSRIYATTSGNQEVGGYMFGLNCYKYIPR